MQIVTPDPCLIMQPHYFSDNFFLDMAMSIMKKLSVFSMFSLSKPLLQSRNFRPAKRKKEGYRKKKNRWIVVFIFADFIQVFSFLLQIRL